MEGMAVDLFATKGLEYVLVVTYLLLLVGCWRMVGPRASQSQTGGLTFDPASKPSFDLRDGFHYHQGHTWACPESGGVMRIGLDDFAQKLLGPITGVILPAIGAPLAQGELGWKVRVGGRAIPILSPVTGTVVAWNAEVLRSPGLVNSGPFDRGWLLEVRVPSPAVAMRNLLSGHLAHAWMDEVTARLDHLYMIQPPTGSFQASEVGVAQASSPDAWEDLTQAFLLTEDRADGRPREVHETREQGQGQQTEFA